MATLGTRAALLQLLPAQVLLLSALARPVSSICLQLQFISHTAHDQPVGCKCKELALL